MRFFTIGHSTRSSEELVGCLTAAHVTRVVDVRRFPGSRRHPHFQSEAMSRTLEQHGIAYVHAPELGGRRPRQQADSDNGFWHNESFRNYADYAQTPPFQQALQELLALGSQDTCALLCAEAVWWRCHRRIIADYLLYHGAEVIHLMGEGRTSPAQMTKAAVPTEEGVLRYPAGP